MRRISKVISLVLCSAMVSAVTLSFMVRDRSFAAVSVRGVPRRDEAVMSVVPRIHSASFQAVRDKRAYNLGDPPLFHVQPVHVAAKMLVIAVAFTDRPATQRLSVFRNLYFNGTHSVAAYYRSVSYGHFQLTGDVVGDPQHPTQFLTLPHSESYYAGTNNGSGSPYPNDDDGLVADAVSKLVREGFNFSPYVQNGQISNIAIVFSGYGADVDPQNKNLIWPVESSLSQPIRVSLQATRAGVGGAADARAKRTGPAQPSVANSGSGPTITTAVISKYVLVPELDDSSGAPSTLGVYAHEFGHLLGLDDLYDTSWSDQAGQGAGPWSIMASGSWNGDPSGTSPAELDPLSRMYLGWVSPTVLRESVTGAILPPFETTPTVYALLPSGKEQDYFLLTNDQQIGYDAGLPESGVLIWHIDGTQAYPESSDWLNNLLDTPKQNQTKHYDVAIEEADASKNLMLPAGDALAYNDTYPAPGGKNRFTATSKPSNALWDGKSLGINVTNISVNGSGVATFDIQDVQSGDSLVIARPSQGLQVYQGQTVPLSAIWTNGARTIDVSRAAKWDSASSGVQMNGARATFLRPGVVSISAFAEHLSALLYLQVVALVRLVDESYPQGHLKSGGAFVAKVSAVYANGVQGDVTNDVSWRVLQPSGGRIVKGRYIGPRIARVVALGSYGGVTTRFVFS